MQNKSIPIIYSMLTSLSTIVLGRYVISTWNTLPNSLANLLRTFLTLQSSQKFPPVYTGHDGELHIKPSQTSWVLSKVGCRDSAFISLIQIILPVRPHCAKATKIRWWHLTHCWKETIPTPFSFASWLSVVTAENRKIEEDKSAISCVHRNSQSVIMLIIQAHW